MTPVFHVTHDAIDADALRAAVAGPENGAVLVFHGTVRARTGDRRVTHLEYEAFVPMAEAKLAEIGREVVAAHGLSALACIHRIGRLEIGEDAVLAAVGAYVRRLKEDVPIWKKEHFEGGAVWIGTPEDPQGRNEAHDG